MTLARRDESIIPRAKARVSQHLSRALPYYLTPDEARKLITVTGNERDRLFLRVLWETGARVSEAISIKLANVGRNGIRVLGKVAKSASSSSRTT